MRQIRNSIKWDRSTELTAGLDSGAETAFGTARRSPRASREMAARAA
ncbi:MAG: hypothetical protein Q7T33_01360 [Dehalococcoidia bacterium]|nr:hypothetical protein [Dehalococcoidia bacterium]